MNLDRKDLHGPKKRGKELRRIHVDLVNSRPLPSDSPRDHCIAVDQFVFGIQEFLKRGVVLVENRGSIIGVLGEKLSGCVKAFDKVALVIKD
jgi:hypothetical protein